MKDKMRLFTERLKASDGQMTSKDDKLAKDGTQLSYAAKGETEVQGPR